MTKFIKSKWLLLLLIGSSFAIATDHARLLKISKSMESFANTYRIINHQYVDETDPNQLMRIAIDSMLSHLDPYTNYFSEAQIVQVRIGMKGGWDGIGIELTKFDKQVIIKEVVENTPAEKNNLRVGDILLEIDGTAIGQQKITDVLQSLQGKAGTNVQIKVKNPASQLVRDLQITRAKVTKKNVPYYGMLNDSTGYIILTTFSQRAGANVQEALETLQEDFYPKQIILDLRNNGGGFLMEAVNICNLFVPRGKTIVSTINKVEKWDHTFRTANAIVDGNVPLIVLINGKSASASEIVAGALQDFDRAVLLGRNSFGKGLVQNTKDIGYKSQLKLTTAKYYIPSGRCIQAIDYQDGKAVHTPDSLRKSFKTVNGRIVFDGNGLQPDYPVDEEIKPIVINWLHKQHLIFNFATTYRTQHDSISTAKTFVISQQEYQDFAKMALPLWLDYQTASEKAMDSLAKQATLEGSYSKISATIAKAKTHILTNKKEDFKRHEDKIKKALEQEIVGRYYYMKGQVENRLARDKDVLEAIDLFANKNKFNQLLAPKSN